MAIKIRKEDKEMLDLFKQAENHWSRPEWLCKIIGWNYTQDGLCSYFRWKHRISFFDGKLDDLKGLWVKHRTTSQIHMYHFKNRKERLQAIRQVIKELKSVI